MKKVVLLITLVFAANIFANAQFTLGIKGGLSSSGVDVKNANNTVTGLKDSDNITGYHIGAFTRVNLSNLFIQPEAYFASSGGKLEQNDFQNNNVDEIKARFNRLDVPILVGYKFLNVVRIQAGPVASVLVNSKLGDQNVKSYLDNADWGYQIGAGLDISNLTLDVRYENLNREYTSQTSSFDMSNQQVIVSLGIKLLGK